MAWRRPGDKPLSEPLTISLPTHICVTRPQWVKTKHKKAHPSKTKHNNPWVIHCHITMSAVVNTMYIMTVPIIIYCRSIWWFSIMISIFVIYDGGGGGWKESRCLHYLVPPCTAPAYMPAPAYVHILLSCELTAAIVAHDIVFICSVFMASFTRWTDYSV